MKKTYLTPSAKAIAVKCGFHLLRQHSVRAFIVETTRFIGDDVNEDDEDDDGPHGSRYIGDVDEE